MTMRTHPFRKLASVAFLVATLLLSEATLAADADKFRRLRAQTDMCPDKSIRGQADCTGEMFGRVGEGSDYGDPKPGPTPRTRDNPRILAAKLNEARLGLEFRAEGDEVVADLTAAQRENLGRVMQRAAGELGRTTGDIVFDINDKRQLVVMNVYEISPVPVVDNFIWMRNGDAAAFAMALATGDAAKMMEAQANAPARRAAAGEQARPQDARPSARGRLNDLLSRLKAPGAGAARDEAVGVGAARPSVEAAPAQVVTSPPPGASANPFDAWKAKTGVTSSTATSTPPQMDVLPGLPDAPPGAVVADLRSGSNDADAPELERIVSAIASPEAFNLVMKPANRSAVYANLAEFLARPRPAARQAELIAHAVILMKSSGVLNADGSPMSMEQAFPGTSSQAPRTIWLRPELTRVLLGDAPPSSEKNAFAPKAANPSAMDMLYRAYLPIFDRTTRTAVPMERVLNFMELLSSNIAQKNAAGSLVPAGTAFEGQTVQSDLAALGFTQSGSPVAVNGRPTYKLTYAAKRGDPPRVLFDVGEIKAALAAARSTTAGVTAPRR